jgi:hypothetical protein
MSRIIDYSKWDQLKYSSSEEDDDEGEKKNAEIARRSAALENLSLCSSSSSPIWNGLVLHHKEISLCSSSSSPIWNGLVLDQKDVFVTHVLPKLNRTDRFFFSRVNRESSGVLAYARLKVSELRAMVHECTSISTMEWMWNTFPWGKKDSGGYVIDQANFCYQVAVTNKLEFLKWAREVKHCEWDKQTINKAAFNGNLEMLKYCFSNGCPCDEEESYKQAAWKGNLDCLRFLSDKVKPSRETDEEAAPHAAGNGHLDILKYFIEERKICDESKESCVAIATAQGKFDCLKYLVEEAKVPLNRWRYNAITRYYEHLECLHYLQEKGCPEPTDEQYAEFLENMKGSRLEALKRMAEALPAEYR